MTRPRGPSSAASAADPVQMLRAQRPFLTLVSAVAVLRFLLPPGRVPGAQETWITVAALWLLGIAWVVVTDRIRRPVGECVGDIGAQNLGIQTLIVVPSVVLGLFRLAAEAEEVSTAFPTNAVVTAIFLPLATLVILTLLALPVLWVLHGARALFVPGAVVVLVSAASAGGCRPAPAPAPDLDPAAAAAGQRTYMSNGCANCHGEDGSGRGAIGAGLDPPPRDYRDPAAYRVGTDVETIAQTIADGLPAPGGGMPSFGHLSLERRTQLATYISSLQHPDSTQVSVRDAWIGESIPGVDTTGAWLTISNAGAEDAVLEVQVEGVRRARLHAMRHADGMMTMEPLAELGLPAGGEVELSAGGNHIMLERLDEPLSAGESVQITLFLKSRTAVRFIAPVRRRDGAQ